MVVKRSSRSETPASPLLVMEKGWLCPNCKRAHAPDVKTCPVDTRPLRDRIKVWND